MFIMTVISYPLTVANEVGSRFRKLMEAPGRPEYMKLIGLWGYTSEGKWNFVQVFEVEEKSKVPDALERNESVFFQTYGDIPGFAYTNRIAYTPEEAFRISGTG